MKSSALILAFSTVLFPVTVHAILEASPLPTRSQPALTGAGSQSTAWPTQSKVRFQLRTATLSFEHQPLVYQQFVANRLTLQIRLSDLDDWRIIPAGPYSLNLTNRWHTDVIAYVAWFPSGSFLSTLEDEAWHGYLRGITRQHQGKLAFEFNDDTHRNSQMLQVMGQRTRLLAYETRPEDQEEPPEARLQVAVEFDGGIIVIGMQGPPRSLMQCRLQFSRLVTGFESISSP